MSGQEQLAAVVRILAHQVDVRPGIAGMVLVDRIPMVRVAGDRLLLLPLVVGINRIDARTVAKDEDPVRIALEILDRLAVARPSAA